VAQPQPFSCLLVTFTLGLCVPQNPVFPAHLLTLPPTLAGHNHQSANLVPADAYNDRRQHAVHTCVLCGMPFSAPNAFGTWLLLRLAVRLSWIACPATTAPVTDRLAIFQ
jgi:hypothetical protein